MGVIPCRCLRNSTVNTIEIMGPAEGDLCAHPSVMFFAKTDAQFCTGKAGPNLRETAETVRVLGEPYEHSQNQNETSFYKRLAADQSLLAVQRLPKGSGFTSGAIVSREEVLMRISDGVVRILQAELPDSPLLIDYEGRWVERASGTFVFQHLYTEKPFIPLEPQSSKVRVCRRPWHTPTYCLADGRVYYGETFERRPQGVGILITAHPESMYKGDFYQGLPHGVGVLQTQTFSAEGYWEQGWFVKGFVKYLDDFQYTGTLKDGRPEGIGNFKDFAHKSGYNGQFKQGYYEGQGIYFSSLYVYRGGFEKGKKNGAGSLQYLPTKDQPQTTLRGVWKEDALSR